MKNSRKLLVALAAVAFSAGANAATMSFDDGSGSYTSGSVTGTASTTGGPLFYNPVENAIGVGDDVFNGAIASGETLSVSFSETINVTKVYFTQWENPLCFFGCTTLDEVAFDYSPGGSLTFTDSGQGIFDLVDGFSTGGIELSSFTIIPQTSLTAVYLHSIDYEVVAPVPLPAAAWLFGSALLGLGGIARRKKA